LPEYFIGDVDIFKIAEFFCAHLEIQAARSERTPFTPPIAVIIDAGNMIRFFTIFFGRVNFRGQEISPHLQWLHKNMTLHITNQ
jgi:hypothetical protein